MLLPLVDTFDCVPPKKIYEEDKIYSNAEMQRIYQAIDKEYGYEDDGFLLCDCDGRTKVSELTSRFRKIRRWAGIQGKSLHTIRRTVATAIYDLHNDINLVKDYLGHSQVSTTWGYVYKSDEKRKAFKGITADLSHMNNVRSNFLFKN